MTLVLQERGDHLTRVKLVYHGAGASPAITIDLERAANGSLLARLVPPSEDATLDYFLHPALYVDEPVRKLLAA